MSQLLGNRPSTSNGFKQDAHFQTKLESYISAKNRAYQARQLDLAKTLNSMVVHLQELLLKLSKLENDKLGLFQANHLTAVSAIRAEMGQLRETIGKRITAFDAKLEEVLTSSPVVFPNIGGIDNQSQSQQSQQPFGYSSEPKVVQPFSAGDNNQSSNVGYSVGNYITLDNGERINVGVGNTGQQQQQHDSPSFLKDYFASSFHSNTELQNSMGSSNGKQVLQLFLDGKLSPRKGSAHEELFGNSPPRQKTVMMPSPKYRSMEERFEDSSSNMSSSSSLNKQNRDYRQYESRIPKPTGRSGGIRRDGPSRIRQPTRIGNDSTDNNYGNNYGNQSRAKQRLNMELASDGRSDSRSRSEYGGRSQRTNPKMTSMEYQRKKQEEAYQWQLMRQQQEREEMQEMEALAARQREELAKRRGVHGALSIDTDKLNAGASNQQHSVSVVQQQESYEEDFEEEQDTPQKQNQENQESSSSASSSAAASQENISLSSVRTKATITDEDRRLERELMEEQQKIYNPNGGMVRQSLNASGGMSGMTSSDEENDGGLNNTGGSTHSQSSPGIVKDIDSRYHSFEGDQLVELFGADVGQMIFSRKWKNRVDGMHEIERILREFSRDAKQEDQAEGDEEQVVGVKRALPDHISHDDALKITSYAVKVGMNDKNIHVFLAALRLLQYSIGTFGETTSHGIINSLFADDLDIVMEKGADTNARIREQSKDTLVYLAKRPNVGVGFIAHLVLRHAKKRSTSFRAVIARVVVLRDLVEKFGCAQDTWLTLKHLMPYLLWAFNHPNGDARAETHNAILTIYSQVHEELLPYLKNVKPMVKRQLLDDFADIDGKPRPSEVEKMKQKKAQDERARKKEEIQRLQAQVAEMRKITDVMDAKVALQQIGLENGEEKEGKDNKKGEETKKVEETVEEKKVVPKKPKQASPKQQSSSPKQQSSSPKQQSSSPKKPKEAKSEEKQVSPKISKVSNVTTVSETSPKKTTTTTITSPTSGAKKSLTVSVEKRKTKTVRTSATKKTKTTTTSTTEEKTPKKKHVPAYMRGTASSSAKGSPK